MWVKARTAQRSSNLEGFLQGLLNGLALGGGIEFWRAGGGSVSPEQVFLWMDNYCRGAPLSDITRGSMS